MIIAPILLFVLAGILAFVAVIGLHATVVSARSKRIPRWIAIPFGAAMLLTLVGLLLLR